MALLSAQMEGHHPLPGAVPDNIPDGFRFVQWRRFSFDLPTSPTRRELYDLQVELDHQCLQHVAGVESEHDVISEANWAKAAALRLSEPLNEVRHPRSSEFYQIQFRALIASLALLNHIGVAALDQSPWNRLNDALTAQFGSIAYQTNPDTTLSENMVHTTNLYLIQLASKYMSFIPRGGSVVPLIAGPAITIVFATLAIVGGQYNHAQRILEALNELLALLRRPQARYRKLCVLQEYIRLVISLDRDSTRASALLTERTQVRESVGLVVSTLLGNVHTLLAEEGQEHLDGRPRIGRQWPRVRAAIGRGPPDLDRAWFYYGLLDCAAQIAALTDTQSLRDKGIFDGMRELIFGDESQEYRWKAIEVLLCCRDPPNDMYNILRVEMEQKPEREMLLAELNAVREHLENNERHGLQSRLSPLLPELPIVESMQSPASSIARINTRESLAASCLEQDLVGSRPREPETHQLRFPEHGQGLFRSNISYHSAGLSIDCKHAVLYNDTRLVAFRLERLNPSEPGSFPAILSKQFRQSEFILNIIMGQRSLIIVTNRCLLALDITRGGNSPLGSIPHGDFDCSGITCHEDDTQLIVMLGQRGRVRDGNLGRDVYIGRIQIIKFRFDGNGRPEHTDNISLTDHDWPKLLSYTAATKTLVCITRLRNRVMAWEMNNNFSTPPMYPFDFVHRYTEETGVTGITSATTFKGPSGTIYVACTTSPSSERYWNDGEWSFISPLSYRRGPELRPPNPPFHNLEQFREHRALTVGCVSRTHNVLAVLEDSGEISILSLKNHERGGICGEDDAERLSEALHKHEKPSTSCLRFDPAGERLFAIDIKGKIIMTEFEG